MIRVVTYNNGNNKIIVKNENNKINNNEYPLEWKL